MVTLPSASRVPGLEPVRAAAEEIWPKSSHLGRRSVDCSAYARDNLTAFSSMHRCMSWTQALHARTRHFERTAARDGLVPPRPRSPFAHTRDASQSLAGRRYVVSKHGGATTSTPEAAHCVVRPQRPHPRPPTICRPSLPRSLAAIRYVAYTTCRGDVLTFMHFPGRCLAVAVVAGPSG